MKKTIKIASYALYLLWWCAVWLLITVPTQLPECYERSKVNAPWEHTGIFNELMGFLGSRLLMEIPFGLIWGSLSWLLQWASSAIVGRFPMPHLLEKRVSTSLWFHIVPLVLLACVEAILLSIPLGYLNADWANFSLAIEDSPPVTISDNSIRIESAGIMLAFPLACMVAGYLAVKRRHLDGHAAAVGQNDV